MNIIVLCGGISPERDVSLTSGSVVAAALRRKGHKAVLMDVYFGYTGEYDDPAEIFEKPYDDSISKVGENARISRL
jgi:D-alanine-D-alanine ligase